MVFNKFSLALTIGRTLDDFNSLAARAGWKVGMTHKVKRVRRLESGKTVPEEVETVATQGKTVIRKRQAQIKSEENIKKILGI